MLPIGRTRSFSKAIADRTRPASQKAARPARAAAVEQVAENSSQVPDISETSEQKSGKSGKKRVVSRRKKAVMSKKDASPSSSDASRDSNGNNSAAEAGEASSQSRRKKSTAARRKPRAKRKKGGTGRGGIILTARRKLLEHLQKLADSISGSLEDEQTQNDWKKAEKSIGYSFKKPALLRLALTHASVTQIEAPLLPWVGDSLLYTMVTEQLAAKYPGTSLRVLHDARERLVSRQSCALRCRKLELDSHLVYGAALTNQPYFDRTTYRATVNMAGELFEAVLGAVYIDGGLRAASRFFRLCFDLPEEITQIPEPSEAIQRVFRNGT